MLFEFQPLNPNNRARDVSFLYRSLLSLGKGGEEKRKKPAFCSAPSPGSEGSFKGWEGALITRAFCREPKHVRAAPPSDPRPAETASRGTLLSPSWASRSASLSSRHFLVFLQTGGGCFRTAGVSCQRPVGGGISRAIHRQPSYLDARSPSRLSKPSALWAALAHSPVSRLRLGEVRRSRFPAGWAGPSGSSCR